MKDLVAFTPETSASDRVIVFEPVRVRSGAIWRIVDFAKSAMLVWGGISLAGVAGAAVIYGKDGLGPYLQAEAPGPALSVDAAPATLAVAAPAPPASPAAPSLRQPHGSGTDAPQGLAALTLPANSPAPVMAASDPATAIIDIPPPPSFSPLAGSADAIAPEEQASAARLPRARPDDEVATASIERQHDTLPWRFRTLRQLQPSHPYAKRYRLVRPRFASRRARVYYRW